MGFFSFIGDHPLLTHKVYLLWKTMFSSPDVMKTRLEDHRLKIDWQLRRIYRARNYVMHSGRSVPNVRQLIQHLNTYYIMMVHTVIHELTSHPEWGLAEVCLSRKSIYANAIKRLENHASHPVTMDNIIQFFSPVNRESEQAWKHLLEKKP